MTNRIAVSPSATYVRGHLDHPKPYAPVLESSGLEFRFDGGCRFALGCRGLFHTFECDFEQDTISKRFVRSSQGKQPRSWVFADPRRKSSAPTGTRIASGNFDHEIKGEIIPRIK